MSTFDADSFMNETTEGEMSTEYINVPENEYDAYIGKVTPRQFPRKDQSGVVTVLDVFWEINDPSLEEVTGRDKNTVKQTLFLDMKDDGSMDLSSGKNIGLGKLREALGQNDSGRPWSPAMLNGAAAIIRVTHRAYDKDGEQKFAAEVSAVRSA